MNNLVYLSYGQGPHIDELVYSVLCALHLIGPNSSDYRIIVYTDNPAALGQLPVHMELLSEKVLADWDGPFEYIYRRKIFAVRDALQKFGGRLAFCDTDTYFLKHPRKLFARIRPGHTVMYNKEGPPDRLRLIDLADFLRNHQLQTLAGRPWNITRYTPIFNSGVIGLDEADISLLDEVVHLIDQIYPKLGYFATEQFALGACFAQCTTLREAQHLVNHYWPPAPRALFREQLSRVLHDGSIPSDEERFRRLFPLRQKILNRPESVKRKLYVALWNAANRAGILNPLKKIIARTGLKKLAEAHRGLN
jgi:hypothetical protein